MARYRDRAGRRYFRADAAFASPEVYEYLEAEGYLHAIRLPGNQVLQRRISPLLRRPVGWPPKSVRRIFYSFDDQAGSWNRARRVVAKIEWHPGELLPRVGFVVTNLSRTAERVVAFYNRRGTAEPWIEEGKQAIKWTRLSCRRFRANEVRLQLHALACNLANAIRTLGLPGRVAHWSLTTLREKLIKIGARMVRHGRYITLPSGGGCRSAPSVRADPVADHPPASATAADVRLRWDRGVRRAREECALPSRTPTHRGPERSLTPV